MEKLINKICLFFAILLFADGISYAQGYAVSLDGVNDYLYASNFTWNSGGPVTIEFWSYVASSDVQSSVAFRLGTGADNIANRMSSSAPFSNSILYWDYGNISGNGRLSVSYSSYLNQWTHIALVSAGNSGNFRGIYINGVLVTSQNSSDGTDGNFTGFTIGHDQLSAFHKGKFDEFRIWNTVRTQQEIQNNKGVSILGSTAGLVAYYKFNEGSGSTALDATSGGYTATLFNSPTWVTSDAPISEDPAVSSVSPSKNAYNINAAGPIAITFNQSMAAATLNANTVFVYGSISGKHTGTIVMSDNNRVCTFTPTVPFKAGETVSANLSSAVQSNAGAYLIRGYHWTYIIRSGTSTGVFSKTNEYATGTEPEAVTTADFNGDGYIDFASVNRTSATINVYSNNASGGFTISATLNTGTNPRDILAVDIDKDGDLDLATANWNDPGSVSIFTNNGAGTFTITGSPAVGQQPISLTAADFDNDGDIDIATGNSAQTFSILLNNGSGTYSLGATINVGLTVKDIRAADVNADGSMDLLIAYGINSMGGISTYTNNGSGSFTYFNLIGTGSEGEGIDIGDFDGDGDIDVVYAGRNNNYLYIMVGNGYGSYSESQYIYMGANTAPNKVAVADIEGDGDLDVIVAATGTLYVTTFTNNGSGYFTPLANITSGNSVVKNLNIGDFDANGTVDIAVVNSSNSITVLKNNTIVVPAMSVTSVTPVKNALHILPTTTISATFNKSLQTDSINARTVMVMGSVSGKHTGVINFSGMNNIFTFTPSQPFKNGEVVTVSLSKNIISWQNEALTAGYTWSFTVKTAVSSSAYYLLTSAAVGTNPIAITGADISGDGSVDFSILNQNSANVSHFINNGTGTFLSGGTTSGVTDGRSMVSGDFDNDGDIDLAIALYTSNSIVILKNTGTGSYTTSTVSMEGTNPIDITSGDFDGDGDIDLATANNNSSDFSLFLNNGSGLFSYSKRFATGSIPYGITAGDFNGDGYKDIATANMGGNSITIFTNDGSGWFFVTSTNSLSGNPNPYKIVAGDFDADGDVDIAELNISAENVGILTNNGSGVFTITQAIVVGSNPKGLITGDFDGSGSLDLAVAVANTQMIKILSNNGSGSFSNSENITISGGSPVALFAADVTGNGVHEIGITDNTNTLKVYRRATFPGMPTNVSAVALNGQAVISFTHPLDNGGASITLYTATSFPGGLSGTCNENTSQITVSGLTNNIAYTFTVTASNSVGTGSASAPSTEVIPGFQAANVEFNNVGAASLTVQWTNGSSNKRAVFVYTGSSGTAIPANNTTYSANSVFGNGSQIGSTGWYCVYNGSGTNVDVTGLTPGFTYRVQVIEYTGNASLEQYYTFTGTGNPANTTTQYTQASSVNYSSILSEHFTVSWTNGAGTKRAVFVYLGTSGNPVLVNNTTYTANTVFGSGSQIGVSGWYCVYNGIGSSVVVTGLTPGTTYRTQVVEYTGNVSAEYYFTSTGVDNPANTTTQYTQASNVNYSSILIEQFTVSWTNGAGTKRAVFVYLGTSGNPVPVNNTTYTANTVFSSGSQIGVSGWYCVYNGIGSSVVVTGLTPGATYRTQVVEYTGNVSEEHYFTSMGENNPANQMTVYTQASNVAFTAILLNQFTISWTNGAGTRRAVFVYLGTSGNSVPVNNTTYTANSVYSSGSQIGESGWYCVYNSTGTSVTVSGLTPNETYRIQVIEYTGSNGSEFYFTSSGANNPKNQTTNELQAANVVFSSLQYGQVRINWTNGGGSNRAAFMKIGSSGTASPVNAISYTANTLLGSGTQIGESGWFCIYNGTDSLVTVTGLTEGETYRVQVVEYYGSQGEENYFASSGMNNPANITMTFVQASNITFSSIQFTQITLNWTAGGGTKRVVFVKNSSSGSTFPTNNTTYSANTMLGSGTQIGESGWFCVFNGIGTNVTITGLVQQQTYRIQVFEYYGGEGNETYFTSSGSDNPNTGYTAFPVGISNVTPSPNANNVSKNSAITVRFNQLIYPDSINHRTFIVTGSVSGTHTGVYTMSNSDSACTFTPAVEFREGEIVSVVLTDKILSATGSNLTTGFSWMFTIKTKAGPKQFSAATTTSTGTLPHDMLSADIDGDGDTDIITANNSTNFITVAKNDGTGIFTQTNYSGENYALSVSSGDYDGDGDIDLLAGVADGVRVMINNGNGVFSLGTKSLIGNFIFSIGSGDIDNDGDVDIVALNYSEWQVYVAKNNGTGVFTTTQTTHTGFYYPHYIVMGDFDGGGHLDCAVGFDFSWTFFSNNGNGHFNTTLGTYNFGNISGIVAADFNNNGALDIGTANSNVPYTNIYFGSGVWTFPNYLNLQNDYLYQSTDAASGDIDGDGDIEIAISNNYSTNNIYNGAIFVWDNNGTGQFPAAYTVGGGNRLSSLVTADFNGDGILDIAGAHDLNNVVKSYLQITPQASSVAFTNIMVTQSTISWTNGNGPTRAVFIKQTTSGSPTPVNLTTYSANAVFGLGSQIGNTGWFCIYNGTGSTVEVSGLTQDLTYRLAVIDYAGGAGNENYYTTVGINNPANVVPSIIAASNVTFSETSGSNLTASWTNGNGSKRAVFILSGSSGSSAPVNAVTYSANTVFTNGSQIGNSGWYCVYNGTGTSVVVTGLTENNIYRISVIEYTGTEGVEQYFTVSGTQNPANSPMLVFPPQIINILPSNFSRNIVPASTISVRFSKQMSPDSLNERTFRVYGSQTGLHSGVISFINSDSTVVFTPASNFRKGETVSLSLATSIKSAAGGYLTKAMHSMFNIQSEAAAGTFSLASTIASGANPQGMCIADFDNDGDNDIATGNRDAGTVSIIKNDGSAVFTLPSSINVGNQPNSVVPADFDGDGDIDIAVSNIGSGSVSILMNNGTGTFSVYSNITTGAEPHNLVSADFTGDGILDIALSHWSGAAVIILGNDGSANFSTVSSTATGSVTGALTCGDFDNDGDIDIATSHYFDGEMKVYFNDGTGQLTLQAVYGSVNNAYILNTGDLNGDGYLDIAVAAIGLNVVAVFINNGSGEFNSTGVPTGDGTHAVSIGDFNGNGTLDIVTANITGENITIIYNGGSADFTTSTNTAGVTPYMPVAADLNNDGRLDFAMLSHTSSLIQIYLNNEPEPLPVELVLFKGLVKKYKAELEWVTATEVNNYGFEIERTSTPYTITDSKPVGGRIGNPALNPDNTKEWKNIGFVRGSGNSNSSKQYFFTDHEAKTGTHFYRLKQVDSDGSFSYSGVVEINIVPPAGYALTQNYPNPFNPLTSIEFSLPISSAVKLEVYDLLGEKVATVLNETKEAGYYSVLFEAKGLASGTYIYRITAGEFTKIRKMILLK